MKPIFAILAAMSIAAPVFADGHATGDAEAGEKAFRKCKSCHAIVSDTGDVIVKGGKTGPNLYGIYGRQPGSVEGYKYGDDLAAASDILENGWTQEEFVAYVADPKAWLSDKLGTSARSKMSFKLRDEEDAADIWSYLVSVGPES